MREENMVLQTTNNKLTDSQLELKMQVTSLVEQKSQIGSSEQDLKVKLTQVLSEI
jgi:hypothetical protein